MINKETINIIDELASVRSKYFGNTSLDEEVYTILDNIITDVLKNMNTSELLKLKYNCIHLMLIFDIEDELKRRFADG